MAAGFSVSEPPIAFPSGGLYNPPAFPDPSAAVVEWVDTTDLKSVGFIAVRVQVPPAAPDFSSPALLSASKMGSVHPPVLPETCIPYNLS